MLLGTWSPENLYRPGGPHGPGHQAAYEAKLAALAAVITELDPALLGVREVGDPGAPEDLAGMPDDDWRIALSARPDGRGVRVGFLSRTEPTVVAGTTAFPGRLLPVQADDAGPTAGRAGHGFLAVEVAGGDGPPLRVAVCHPKSKPLSYPDGRFRPRDEGERARHGAYALYRRAAGATGPCAPWPTTCWRATGGNGTWRSSVTSTTRCGPRPRRSCSGRPARRSARPATTARTTATRAACGTWPR